jgi:hypothetical protein
MVKLRLPRIATECLILFLLCSVAIAQQPAECCSLVLKALDAAERVKPKMTRAEIEKEFSEDGGLSFGNERVYTYKSCSYIKIRVAFEIEAGKKTSLAESPSDIVRSVSQPYLEYPHYD